MDEMDTDATDAVVQEPGSTTIAVGDATYVMLPLACAQNGKHVVVGAVAIVQGEIEVDRVRENELLSLIAAQLLESNSIIATSQLKS